MIIWIIDVILQYKLNFIYFTHYLFESFDMVLSFFYFHWVIHFLNIQFERRLFRFQWWCFISIARKMVIYEGHFVLLLGWDQTRMTPVFRGCDKWILALCVRLSPRNWSGNTTVFLPQRRTYLLIQIPSSSFRVSSR